MTATERVLDVLRRADAGRTDGSFFRAKADAFEAIAADADREGDHLLAERARTLALRAIAQAAQAS